MSPPDERPPVVVQPAPTDGVWRVDDGSNLGWRQPVTSGLGSPAASPKQLVRSVSDATTRLTVTDSEAEMRLEGAPVVSRDHH